MTERVKVERRRSEVAFSPGYGDEGTGDPHSNQ